MIMNKKRIEKLSDLKEVYLPKDLAIVETLHERVAIIRKNGKKISAKSPNNYSLDEKVKDGIKNLLLTKDDFEILCFVLESGIIVVHDVLTYNGNDVGNIDYEKRMMMMDEFLNEKFIKSRMKKILSYEDQAPLFERYEVILKNSSHRFHFDANSSSRSVIISDYYLGNKVGDKREVLFKCYQYYKNRPVYVGKLRISDEKIRSTILRTVKKNKRVVVSVDVIFDKRKTKKFSKLTFNSILRDEKFSNIVVDKELYFKPIIIYNRFGKSSTPYCMVKGKKSLNTLSGAI